MPPAVAAVLLVTALLLPTGSLLTPGAAARYRGADPRLPTSITVSERAEILAKLTIDCDACDWEVPGREAAVLTLALDDRPPQHLPVVRGAAEYAVMLGSVERGAHTVRIGADDALTARDLRGGQAATVAGLSIEPILASSASFEAVSLAPFIHARPDTVGRFTDVPVFMWYEVEPTPRGRRYRYSVIFTNEDGGTPTDRLMATWGRTTDIEYIYGVEVDGNGAILAEEIQGPKHELLPFRGRREGRHPLVWVSTENNMVLDHGSTEVRYAPAPVAFALRDVSREAVMDAHPWLYRLMNQELVRERKIAADAAPGSGMIPDPRRFVYLEACGVVGNAAIAFAVHAGGEWFPSDAGGSDYRIARDGCFRAAVPLARPLGPGDIRAVRVQAFERPARGNAPPKPAGTVTLSRINKLFMLAYDFEPGVPRFHWDRPITLVPGGAPVELPVP